LMMLECKRERLLNARRCFARQESIPSTI
jgi:hypothetical protein